MKTWIYISVAVVLVAALLLVWSISGGKGKPQEMIEQQSNNFYDYTATAIDEETELNMADYKGKKVLIVNVASKCGYTYQYEGLQELHEKYGDKVAVIGFPCNQFLGQEPGSNEEVQSFCRANYGVTFPMAAKINVKGEEQHPLYTWLTHKSLNGVGDYKVSWNFNKFLISEEGKLIAHWDSKVKPMSEEITQHFE